MSLIKCPECGKETPDTAEKCINCGYPLQVKRIQGRAIFQTSNDFIGLLGKYLIKDKNGIIIAKLKSNDNFEISINSDTVFYIKYSGAFSSYKEAYAYADCTNRFSIGLHSGGPDFYVNKQ